MINSRIERMQVVIDERIDALVAELEELSLESETDEALAATQADFTNV